MEAACSSETSILCHNAKAQNLSTHCCEDLKVRICENFEIIILELVIQWMSNHFFLQSLSVLLHAPEREVNSLRKLVATIDSVALKTKSEPEARVAFREDGKTVFVEFLSCFEFGGSSQESSTVSLKKNISEDKLKRNSKFVILTILNTWLESSIHMEPDKEEWTGRRNLQLNVGNQTPGEWGPRYSSNSQSFHLL
jgi:hypothetical protein